MEEYGYRLTWPGRGENREELAGEEAYRFQPGLQEIWEQEGREDICAVGEEKRLLPLLEKNLRGQAGFLYMEFPGHPSPDFDAVPEWLSQVERRLQAAETLVTAEGAIVLCCREAQYTFLQLLSSQILKGRDYLGCLIQASEEGREETGDLYGGHRFYVLYGRKPALKLQAMGRKRLEEAEAEELLCYLTEGLSSEGELILDLFSKDRPAARAAAILSGRAGGRRRALWTLGKEAETEKLRRRFPDTRFCRAVPSYLDSAMEAGLETAHMVEEKLCRMTDREAEPGGWQDRTEQESLWQESLWQERQGLSGRRICIPGVGEPVANRLVEAQGICFWVKEQPGRQRMAAYLRTILELYRSLGFLKFVVIVPTVADRLSLTETIRETAHAYLAFGCQDLRKAAFVCRGDELREISARFVESEELSICILNIQTFNRDTNRVRVSDEYGQIVWDDMAAVRPIVIMDGLRRIEGSRKENSKAIQAAAQLNPLFTICYEDREKEADRGEIL